MDAKDPLRFGVDGDPRRPSTASQRVADEMFAAAKEGEGVGYLCDVRLIEDHANARLALVNYAVDALEREGRAGVVEDILSDAGPLFEKMQRLVNGDPM